MRNQAHLCVERPQAKVPQVLTWHCCECYTSMGVLRIAKCAMNEKRKQQDDSSLYTAFALLAQVGFLIALPLVGGAILGQYIDHTLHDSTPLATIFGLLLGLVVGVSLVFRAITHLPR